MTSKKVLEHDFNTFFVWYCHETKMAPGSSYRPNRRLAISRQPEDIQFQFKVPTLMTRSINPSQNKHSP